MTNTTLEITQNYAQKLFYDLMNEYYERFDSKDITIREIDEMFVKLIVVNQILQSVGEKSIINVDHEETKYVQIETLYQTYLLDSLVGGFDNMADIKVEVQRAEFREDMFIIDSLVGRQFFQFMNEENQLLEVQGPSWGAVFTEDPTLVITQEMVGNSQKEIFDLLMKKSEENLNVALDLISKLD